jgi:class 3 adenylate cyclase
MTSYLVWINGERVGGAGTVGSTSETTIPKLENRNYRLPAGVSQVELLVHVANFDFRGGGLRRKWSVGLDDPITRDAGYELLRYAAFATLCVVIGLVFLVQFGFRPSDVTRGWFGTVTILIGMRVVFANASDLHQLLTGWGSFGWAIRLEYLNTALITFVGLGYFREKIPGVMPPRVTNLIQLSALALVPIHLFASTDMVLATLPLIMALALVASLLAMASWGRAARRQVPGAAATLAAGLAFSLGVAHDIVRTQTGLGAPIEVFPFFVIVWIAIESHALLKSFALSFATVEKRSDELEDSNFELQETEEAVVRFLPLDLLRILGKDSIRDVQAGDHAQTDMTVLRCHLDLTDREDAETIFGRLNEWSQRIDPLIREHGGFLGQQHGDNMLVLFPGGPEEALAAATGIQEVVRQSGPAGSREDGTTVSIGIATGPVFLGTVGGGESLSSVVTSPTVALASRIQEAARRSGAGILVSAATRDHLAASSQFVFRDAAPIAGGGRGESGAVFALATQPEL